MLITSMILGVMPSFALAQTQLTEQQAQRDRAEREARERELRREVPMVEGPSTRRASDYRDTSLPEEEPCFLIRELRLDGDAKNEFSWLNQYLDQYAGRCIGQQGIGLIARRAGDLVLSKGYVTTRVGLPEQNLSAGILTLLIVPGRLHAIRFDDSELPASLWRSAFPLRDGDLINLRALEQGLEQLKRVPSQDATMELVPAQLPGESDVVISLKRERLVRGGWSLDDSGSDSTSRSQLNGSLYLDNPLRRNDMLTLGLSSGMTSRYGFGTNGYSFSYTLPFGNWRAGANAYGYRYQQLVSGTSTTYSVSGESQTGEVIFERLLSRGQRYRTSLELRTGQRSSHTFVAGSELITQRRKGTYAELAVNWRQYMGPAQIDLRLAHKRGLPWLGGDRDESQRPSQAPVSQYGITSLDASLGLPFTAGTLRAYWNSQFHWQHSNDVLFGSEYIAIGGRYTVNGFDGEYTLAAGNGGYWRNSLTFSMAPALQPYIGLDVGKVKADRAVGIEGGHLVGGYIGVRGQVLGGVGWDAFLGWPLQYPEQFISGGRASGFRLYLQY